jgi:hypothetical protein
VCPKVGMEAVAKKKIPAPVGNLTPVFQPVVLVPTLTELATPAV